jgi:DNA-binding beta-propeller fold protein YncE
MSTLRTPLTSAAFLLATFAAWTASAIPSAASETRHYLYVAAPGIRNYFEFGGAGILVFDMDRGHAFVKRIPTAASRLKAPENIKGICACANTGKLYFSTLTRLYCLDLVKEKTVWEKALPGGCDRMSITPDGKHLYVPSLEGAHWNLVDGASGGVVKQIVTKSGAHNTICSLDGTEVYLGGLRSPVLTVVDCATSDVKKTIGPFGGAIRPFTVNAGKTLCLITVNGLLGFEIGDLTTGKKLHRVEVQGYAQGKPKRHGCPSHGVGLTPDEKEAWVCDAANQRVHIFDMASLPPRQVTSVKLREEPGWITFSRDGRFAYPSTGDVIDTKTRQIIAGLRDEEGREVHSEKVMEIVFVDGVPAQTGDQFGLGRQGQGGPATTR